MSEPIAVMVRRYRCPHCGYSRAAKSAATSHIGRCWNNPAVRSCKTCKHFVPASGGGPDHGVYEWNPPEDESCDQGVDLGGMKPCERCHGSGVAVDVGLDFSPCPQCDGSPEAAPRKAGPIVGCPLWEVITA